MNVVKTRGVYIMRLIDPRKKIKIYILFNNKIIGGVIIKRY